MKNRMATLTGPSFGLSFEDAAGASGGGTAVADAPGAAAGDGGGSSGGAAASGGGSAPSQDSGFGFFRNLGTRDLTPKPDRVKTIDAGGQAKIEPAADGAAAASEDQVFEVKDDAGAVMGSFKTQEEADAFVAAGGKAPEVSAAAETFDVIADDGKTVLKSFKTKEEADAFVAEQAGKADGGAPAITADTVLPTPIYGRFKTIKDTEAAFKRQEVELVKLSDANKALKTQAKLEIDRGLVTRDAELASLKAELEIARKTPPFQQLTEDQEDALAKENPAKLTRYLFAKDKNEKDLQKVKDDAAKVVYDRQKRNEALSAEIQRQEVEMRTDKVKYPLYDDDINARMEKLHEMTGGEKSPLAGKAWARTLYYYAVLGSIQANLLRKGQTVKTAMTVHAKKSAGAAAQSTGGTGTGSAAAGKPVVKDANTDWNKKIDEAGGRKVLSFVD